MNNSGIDGREVLGKGATGDGVRIVKAVFSVAEPTRAGRLFMASASSGGKPRYLHSATVLNDGRILFTGGYHVDEAALVCMEDVPSANADIYDPGTDEWLDAAPMLMARARHASILLSDGRVAVIGGYHTGVLDSVEIYDPETDTWTHGDPLPVPACDHEAVLSDGTVLVSGGGLGNVTIEIEFS